VRGARLVEQGRPHGRGDGGGRDDAQVQHG
jgi:hypothetical protein